MSTTDPHRPAPRRSSAPPRLQVATPRRRLPALACDAHMHVFGDVTAYPLDEHRSYDPAPASLEQYRELARALGIGRTVVVQPSPYGSDNRCTLDTVAALGDRARAVVVVPTSVRAADIRLLHQRGARGVRFNLVQTGGSSSLDALETLSDAIAPFGWHVQLYVRGSALPELAPRLQRLPTPIVLDHLGQMDPARGVEQEGFELLLRLLDRGRCWVKLSGAYRLDPRGAPWSAAEPFAAALANSHPERLLWGTDWPHPDLPMPPDGAQAEMPDDARLVERLFDWAGSDRTVHRIVVENPSQVYWADE